MNMDNKMTPPQTPKPLTEKELEKMEERLSRINTSGEYFCWINDYAKPLIKELKRLRAGQARETSSKSEVKILRVALEEIKQIKWMDKSDVGCGFIATRALKQADEIKDGPSEHDKRQYRIFKHALLDQKDRLTWREQKELLNMVSRSWGIE